ncbi:MAG TPA: hypothetical protein VKM55_00610 [Candidatus Lokiarchaeia archaeon]|nr:hypothetical protein [Candidatus Lokiarchaeia archaeon]
MHRIQAAEPSVNVNAIQSAVYDLGKKESTKNLFYKPLRGLFRHVDYKETSAEEIPEPVINIDESKFYQPFADYLVKEREDCTKAISLGGAILKWKWGTPDVYGIWTSKKTDAIQHFEIITAEIKTDFTRANLITGFGQACAYLLFSHKVFFVIPKDSPPEDLDRIESLCNLFGIGLIIFNKGNPDNPGWELKVNPISRTPDVQYANENYKQVEDKLN